MNDELTCTMPHVSIVSINLLCQPLKEGKLGMSPTGSLESNIHYLPSYFYLQRTMYRRLHSVSVLKWKLLSWPKSLDRRQGLVLSIGPNWVGSTWRRRQNPVSRMMCVLNEKRTMVNVQKDNNHTFRMTVFSGEYCRVISKNNLKRYKCKSESKSSGWPL
jgi:hypothetical protein